jgi:hypothetical protein
MRYQPNGASGLPRLVFQGIACQTTKEIAESTVFAEIFGDVVSEEHGGTPYLLNGA